MKRVVPIALAGSVILGAFLAQPKSSAQQSTGNPPTPVPATGPAAAGVRSIALPSLNPDLPPGPGRDTVATTCAFCHSGRYITDQPRFPRQTWVNEVDKMRKTFGAPLTDQQAADAVEYLVAIKGVDQPATKP